MITINVSDAQADMLIDAVTLFGEIITDANIYVNGINILPFTQNVEQLKSTINKSIRYNRLIKQLYEVQGGACNNCKKQFAIWNLELDAITPLAMGGGNGSENHQLLCSSCNREKGGGETLVRFCDLPF